ncbi:MAG: HlyC/CorC family transporter [Clostridia bacterium]|nr:HlyC/CorC family transporter [Clostridia bacterium]
MGADPGSIIIKIVTLFALIFVNAFFSMSEMAIVTLNDNKIDKMANEGNKKAKQIQKLTENTSSFLSTIQIGVTLAGFLTSATAAQSFAEMLAGAIANTPVVKVIPIGIIGGFSTVVITLIMSYFSLVLGELVPKKIAMNKPEKMAFMAAPILVFVAKVTRPIVKFLALSTNGVLRVLGIDPHADKEVVTEEEIRLMVDVGGEKGVIEDTQIEMINNIFEFDDIDVADIMTHRTDMVCVDEDEPLVEAVKLSIENGFSRIPAYREDPDNIVGIVYVKDFLKYVGTNLPKTKTVKDMMRPVFCVPDTKRCGELFTEMTEKRVQMAVVVDEYGGTAGIVTLEDLLESIVGNIQDEYDHEDEEISIINDTTFEVEGITDIEEVEEHIGKTFPDGDYDTIGGYIISVLGFLPEDGQMNEVQFQNVKFTVLNVEDRRIGKVKVEILPIEKKNEVDEENLTWRERREKRNEE